VQQVPTYTQAKPYLLIAERLRKSEKWQKSQKGREKNLRKFQKYQKGGESSRKAEKIAEG
jgi:hypothetical protein